MHYRCRRGRPTTPIICEIELLCRIFFCCRSFVLVEAELDTFELVGRFLDSNSNDGHDHIMNILLASHLHISGWVILFTRKENPRSQHVLVDFPLRQSVCSSKDDLKFVHAFAVEE